MQFEYYIFAFLGAVYAYSLVVFYFEDSKPSNNLFVKSLQIFSLLIFIGSLFYLCYYLHWYNFIRNSSKVITKFIDVWAYLIASQFVFGGILTIILGFVSKNISDMDISPFLKTVLILGVGMVIITIESLLLSILS